MISTFWVFKLSYVCVSVRDPLQALSVFKRPIFTFTSSCAAFGELTCNLSGILGGVFIEQTLENNPWGNPCYVTNTCVGMSPLWTIVIIGYDCYIIIVCSFSRIKIMLCTVKGIITFGCLVCLSPFLRVWGPCTLSNGLLEVTQNKIWHGCLCASHNVQRGYCWFAPIAEWHAHWGTRCFWVSLPSLAFACHSSLWHLYGSTSTAKTFS